MNNCEHDIPNEMLWDTDAARTLGYFVGAITFCPKCKTVFLVWYDWDNDEVKKEPTLKPLTMAEVNCLELAGFKPRKIKTVFFTRNKGANLKFKKMMEKYDCQNYDRHEQPDNH